MSAARVAYRNSIVDGMNARAVHPAAAPREPAPHGESAL